MKVQDYSRGIAAQRDLNALLGLYAPPPAQTLKIMGIDPAELTTVLEALPQQNIQLLLLVYAILTVSAELKKNGHK